MQHHITVKRDKTRVALINKTTGVAYDFDWKLALEAAGVLRKAAHAVLAGFEWGPEIMGRLAIIRGDADVVVLEDSQIALVLPPGIAVEIANAMQTKAQEAQEDVQAQEIISDQALLCRHGAPFGITQDHKKLNQAFRDAQFVKAPAGITHVSKVGTPGLYQPKGV